MGEKYWGERQGRGCSCSEVLQFPVKSGRSGLDGGASYCSSRQRWQQWVEAFTQLSHPSIPPLHAQGRKWTSQGAFRYCGTSLTSNNKPWVRGGGRKGDWCVKGHSHCKVGNWGKGLQPKILWDWCFNYCWHIFETVLQCFPKRILFPSSLNKSGLLSALVRGEMLFFMACRHEQLHCCKQGCESTLQ